MLGKTVIVRSSDAGVHIGECVSLENNNVKLKDAKRLWRWRGANTLNEVAMSGVSEDWTRISEAVPEILIIGACEVIPCSDKAVSTFNPKW